MKGAGTMMAGVALVSLLISLNRYLHTKNVRNKRFLCKILKFVIFFKKIICIFLPEDDMKSCALSSRLETGFKLMRVINSLVARKIDENVTKLRS